MQHLFFLYGPVYDLSPLEVDLAGGGVDSITSLPISTNKLIFYISDQFSYQVFFERILLQVN